MKPQILPWREPLALAASYDGTMALLYSSAQTSYSGGVSLLAVDAVETVDIDALNKLKW